MSIAVIKLSLVSDVVGGSDASVDAVTSAVNVKSLPYELVTVWPIEESELWLFEMLIIENSSSDGLCGNTVVDSSWGAIDD